LCSEDLVSDDQKRAVRAIAAGMGVEARRCACGTLYASREHNACPLCRGIAELCRGIAEGEVSCVRCGHPKGWHTLGEGACLECLCKGWTGLCSGYEAGP
jgi:hypothetical protein